MRFASPEDGFAFGPGLWSTHDGGQHWRYLDNVAGVTDYNVVDLVATHGSIYLIIEHRDAGTYELVHGERAGNTFRHLTWVKSPRDLVAGDRAVFTTDGAALLRISADTVSRRPLPAPSCGTLAASSSAALVSICGEVEASGAMGDRQAYGSTDAGRHWRRLPDPPRGAGYDTLGVAVTTNEHVVISTLGGNSSALLTSTDGGESWQRTLSAEHIEGGYGELGFENDADGVVIEGPSAARAEQSGGPHESGGKLFRTHDGGGSWESVQFTAG
jgi:photosystem II stability/assembly factor-like uncharacterized protein